VLSGALGIAVTDAVMLRRKPINPPKAQAIPERIGLSVQPDGEALELQWNHLSRPVRNADHAIVYIQDGSHQSQLDLNGGELSRSSLRYWPQSHNVTFRMEVYQGRESTSDTLQVPVNMPVRRDTPKVAAAPLRPSPFERVRPEVVRTPALPQRRDAIVPIASEMPAPVELQQEDRPHESGFGRIVGKIPLLRRLKKHPATPGAERSEGN
jgi:hypothetical protein